MRPAGCPAIEMSKKHLTEPIAAEADEKERLQDTRHRRDRARVEDLLMARETRKEQWCMLFGIKGTNLKEKCMYVFMEINSPYVKPKLTIFWVTQR